MVMKAADVVVDRTYECTDPELGGEVTVRSISGGQVYLDCDAEGFALMNVFISSYKPARS
ncbi:hypothetical protein OR214_02021 [Ralstonia pickettii OR214]|jgi:hypothetical protein|uniref:Uncharacterized protein n=2 Tax=Ralstonia pickettii TaxID=329 RepID=R0CMR2_RALPI|nr:hypothetical protein OR214_02021 [Ralstonia pickettii OR214]